jgi:hypothetical protein
VWDLHGVPEHIRARRPAPTAIEPETPAQSVA